ncbi:phage tail sheath family protein [Microcoleus sp. FACHB-84]|nr:phage tail sheath family protein [Microcoleus sp. FACHB-84]
MKINGEKIQDTNVKISLDDTNRVATLTLNQIQNKEKQTITADYQVTFPTFQPVPSGEVKLCTNFKEFKKFFGDFSQNEGQQQLAHAVSGFFNNGGTRCYVMRVENLDKIDTLLESLEAIDEIAIVAAPGITTPAARSAIITHCQQKTGDRIAILDCKEDDTSSTIKKPDNSNYAAFYFPWIQVFDPATKTANPDGDGLISVPPSGHIAGIYARVDAQRGVHKAPANEIVLGALGLNQNLSKNQQDGLNPQGINCIRNLNGNIRVWGARTIGGDANGEFKYINVRRLFNYLKKSIDQGTQWTVFEPNSPELWAKIRRNVTAFLMTVWRSGALFGNTPEQAFYVKCDEETNPPELREQGKVVTEIGVAIVKPAEFVIFNLSQWAGPGK